MVWTRSEVKIGPYVLLGTRVTPGPGRPMMFGLRRPAPRTASITGFAQVQDLAAIYERIEAREPMEQSGVFPDGVLLFLTSLSLRCEDDAGDRAAAYQIDVMEARLVNDGRETTCTSVRGQR